MIGAIKQREYTWDVMKFILIALVVLGHWLEYGLESRVNQVTFNIIYLFHMPLFIFISGFFSQKKDDLKFRKSILRLIETYFVVQILYCLTSFFLQHKPFTIRHLYVPNAAAWYLLSLILWRLFLQIIPDKWLKSKMTLPISFIVSVLAGFLPIGNELSLQRTLAFLPFFLGGYYLNDKMKFCTSTGILKWSCISVLGIIVIASCFLDHDISYVIWCNSNYYIPNFRWTFPMFRAVYLGIASLMIVCILKLFPRITKPGLLSHLGTDTLFFYVYHIIVMRVGIVLVRYYHFSFLFPSLLCYTIASLFILFFLSKLKALHRLLNPISTLIRSNSNVL